MGRRKASDARKAREKRSADAGAETSEGWQGLKLCVAGFAAGLVMSQGLGELEFWPLGLAGLVLIARLSLNTGSPFHATWLGLSAGFGYFAPNLYWIANAFFVDADRFALLSPLAVIGLPLLLAIFWAAAFALWRLLTGLAHARRTAALHLPLLAALWALAELLREHLLTGFPWAKPVYSTIDSWFYQLAALIGPEGANFLWLLSGCLIAQGAVSAGLRRRAVAFGLSASILGAGFAWGALRAGDMAEASRHGPIIRLVQPNIAQRDKWDPAKRPEILTRYMSLSEQPSRLPSAPSLIIWPETALPFAMEEQHALRSQLMTLLRQAHGPVQLILGSQRRKTDAGDTRWYNSAFQLDSEGNIVASYDKIHLVPFGEYLPLASVLRAAGLSQLAGSVGGFTAGTASGEAHRFGLRSPEADSPLAISICYEIIFARETRITARGASALIQLTNDAWFGSSIGPGQHLRQAQARAVELGLPVLRAANTGISSYIRPDGQIIHHLALGAPGIVDFHMTSGTHTSYMRNGDIFFWLFEFMIFVLWVFWSRFRGLRD